MATLKLRTDESNIFVGFNEHVGHFATQFDNETDECMDRVNGAPEVQEFLESNQVWDDVPRNVQTALVLDLPWHRQGVARSAMHRPLIAVVR